MRGRLALACSALPRGDRLHPQNRAAPAPSQTPRHIAHCLRHCGASTISAKGT